MRTIQPLLFLAFFSASCGEEKIYIESSPLHQIKSFSENKKHRFVHTQTYIIDYDENCSIFLDVYDYLNSGYLGLSITSAKTRFRHIRRTDSRDFCSDDKVFSEPIILNIIDETLKFSMKELDREIEYFTVNIDMLESVQKDMASILYQKSIESPELAIQHNEMDAIQLDPALKDQFRNNQFIITLCNLFQKYAYECTFDNQITSFGFNFDIKRYSDITIDYATSIQVGARFSFKLKNTSNID